MNGKGTSVKEYLAALPADRRAAMEVVRDVILKNLGSGFEEGIQYGMIGYYVPHRLYPAGYHCDPKQPLPFAALGSQKNHMALYMMFLYGSPKQKQGFLKEWAKTGKKLDMGKSCLRFKKAEDLALEVIGKAVGRIGVRQFITTYEAALRRAD